MDNDINQVFTGATVQAPEWDEWRKTSSYIPRKSVYGRWIIGPMYKRGKWEYHRTDLVGGEKVRIREYATKKELFKWKLANGRQTNNLRHRGDAEVDRAQ